MFVKGNNLKDVKAYFSSKLADKFSQSEINLMIKLIVCKRLDVSQSEYLIGHNLLFSESDLLYVREVVQRLLNNEPFQYILGEVEFYGVELKVDKRALIPRPETEELVDWVVMCENMPPDARILDLCAGSGCIAFAIKSQVPDGTITAVEYSDDALALIEENCQKTGLDIGQQSMDVLNKEEYSRFEKFSFDVWVSNPPYIPERDKELMHKNVLEHEPHMALFVEDDDPLVFYRCIAEQARVYLKDQGWLYFEIHEGLAEDVIGMLRMLEFVNIELRKDLQGKDRMVRAQTVNSQHES